MIVYTESDKIALPLLVIGILLNAYCFFDDLSTANMINLIAMLAASIVFIWHSVWLLKYRRLRIGSLVVIKFLSIYFAKDFLISNSIKDFEIHGNYLVIKVDSEDTLSAITENLNNLTITYIKNG